MLSDMIQNLRRQSAGFVHSGKIAGIKQVYPISRTPRFISFFEHQMPSPFLIISDAIDQICL